MTQVRFSVGRYLPDGAAAAYGIVRCAPDRRVTIRGCANYTAADWPHIERQITAGRLPAAWFAPPRDAPAGIKTTPRLIP